eukprot:9559950-Ditylum_brightwellii.AAC.1
MRTANERPPAKPPWATPASTAHPLHSHSLDHTPNITNNQENQTKRHAPTASSSNPQSYIQPQASKFLQYKSTYNYPSELQQKTSAHTSQPIIALWHLLLLLLNLHATLHHFNYLFILLSSYAAVLQSGQVQGSALAPNTAELPTNATPQQPTLPCSTEGNAAA